MDIFVIYIIKTLLLPIASLLIVSLVGLFLLSKNRGLATSLISFSIAGLLFLSLPIVAKALAATQETYPPLKSSAVDEFSAQAIVVLGGGLRSPAPEYDQQVTLKNRTLLRVRYAAILAKQSQLPVLVSGGKVFNMELPSEAELMADTLTNEFSQRVTWQEGNSRNTAENALYTHKVLSKENVQRIILVTHALHMRRAVEQFQFQGFHVLPAPTAFLSLSDELSVFSFLPSAAALQCSSAVIHEMMGRLWYQLRYSEG